MGMTLKFLSGDQSGILEAMEECDYDRLDDPAIVFAGADFSLHLEPRDLNFLSQQIGMATAQEPLPLRPYLEPVVDHEDFGALLVGREWVEYVATLPLNESDTVALRWVEAMTAHYGEPVEINSDVRRAVSDLISLCHRAKASGGCVIHIWIH